MTPAPSTATERIMRLSLRHSCFVFSLPCDLPRLACPRRMCDSSDASSSQPQVILRLSLLFLVIAQTAAAQTAAEVRAAVSRALPVLQRSASVFVEQRACVSCHHNSLAVLTLRMARQRGLEIDATALGTIEARTFRELRSAAALDDAVQAANLSD